MKHFVVTNILQCFFLVFRYKLTVMTCLAPSDCQCRRRNSPGFDSSILRHSGIWGAADEAVLNTVHRKNPKNFLCLTMSCPRVWKRLRDFMIKNIHERNVRNADIYISSCLWQKNAGLMHNCSKQSHRKNRFFCVHKFSYFCTRTYSIWSFKIWNSICIRQALVDLCPARTKMKINVINLRPRTHIFYLDLSPRRCMGGGSCRDSTEQQWAYLLHDRPYAVRDDSTEHPNVCLQLFKYNTYSEFLRNNFHLFLTVQSKRKHRQLYSKYPLRTLPGFIGMVGMSRGTWGVFTVYSVDYLLTNSTLDPQIT